MTSSLHARGYPPTPYQNSGFRSQTNPYGPAAMRMDQNGGQQGLFPPPAPSETPRPNINIMNRRGDENSSLYQICLNLRRRMAEVPGFEVHMLEMEEEEAELDDSTDPVTSMWNCLRRGYPLMTIYNALGPRVPLEVDASRMAEAKLGKAATFKFLQACLTDMKYSAGECFLITDLYGGDTTGFVKVTKVVNRVLDELDTRGLLLHTESHNRNGEKEKTPPLTYRQNVVKEIVTSERDYVSFLETLQNFKKELEECGAIAGDALHDIFLNLNSLLDFQRRFLIRIEQQNSLPESQQNWGQLFIQYKDSFRVYEPFIANQVRCNSAVLKEWDKIKAAPLSPNLSGMVEVQSVLLGFLLKPFQRLSKYPLLLEELRKKGGLDEERKQDLTNGMSAATSILLRANEAIAKEQRLAAVSELQNRVEDWKGHQIDHFGELLLFGDYTVVKGEGAKEVEREVRIRVVFDALTPRCRMLVRLAADQSPEKTSQFCFRAYVGIKWHRTPVHKRLPTPSQSALARYSAALQSSGLLSPTARSPIVPSPRAPKRFVSGLEGVPEEDSLKADEEYSTGLSAEAVGDSSQAAVSTLATPSSTAKTPKLRGQQSRFGLNSFYKGGIPSRDSPSSPFASNSANSGFPLSRPSSGEGMGSDGGSAPPTPSRRSHQRSYGKMAEFSNRMKVQGSKAKKVLMKSPRAPVDPRMYQYLLFNGPLGDESPFHAPKQPAVAEAMRVTNTDLASAKRRRKLPPRPALEKDFCDEHELTNPVRVQYKVYLFERILLCCKEINPNKPKNKMLGNSKPLTDRKGKLRLQLKGRIFMQNVTDVLTVVKSDKADYKIQIFWKGDPGVENFVIRFLNEADMNTWRDQVQMQKKTLSESARSSGQAGTSDTELVSMRDQSTLRNPYLDEEIEEDDSQATTTVPGSSVLGMSRNASSNSLRSAGMTPNGSARGPPPRFPMPDPAAYQPPLSLQTNFPPGATSPAEFAGNSYFSPGGDSPMSTRSSSQTSMWGLPRQSTPRLSNEEAKHRTAPAMPRAPSRDGSRPINGYTIDGRTVMRPSLPAMGGPQNAQQQLAMTQQSRLRSASTPDIQPGNGNGPRRYANGQLQPNVENVPVPPIPSHMRPGALIARSQTSSPTNGSLPTRSNTQSPMHQRDKLQRQTAEGTKYDQQMHQRLQAIPHSEPRRYQEGGYADASLQVIGSSPAPTTATSNDSGIPYPTQLKVKIHFEPQPSHVTIVVPIIIKHRSLVDRIDSKMTKISSASISKDTARLRYRDEDGDMITINTDDDVQIAIDDWANSSEEPLRKGVYPDFELFWTPL